MSIYGQIYGIILCWCRSVLDDTLLNICIVAKILNKKVKL